MAEQAKIKDHEKQLVDHGFATYEFDKLPFIIETSGAWSVKAVALWKRTKSPHKAAVADGFATATFLNTKQAAQQAHTHLVCFHFRIVVSTEDIFLSSKVDGISRPCWN